MLHVVIEVGPKEVENDKLPIYVAPWADQRVELCPIPAATNAKTLQSAFVTLVRTVTHPRRVHVYPDEEPFEWDYPTRALGNGPYDDNEKIGYNAIQVHRSRNPSAGSIKVHHLRYSTKFIVAHSQVTLNPHTIQ